MTNYTYMLWELTKRDIRNKYAGSLFGFLWNIILPISYIIIYTTVFSELMAAKLPNMNGTFDYSVYLSAGILAWTIFNNTLVKLQNIFLENSNLVKKVYFPKYILILSAILSSLIDLFINYFLLLIVLLIINYHENYTYLFVVLIGVLQQIFALGLGLILSVICVHFKDLNQFIQIILPLWFWFTPIVYSKEILPMYFTKIIDWNPLFYFIKQYQDIILFNQVNWSGFGMMLLISMVTFLLGWLVYRKFIGGIADII